MLGHSHGTASGQILAQLASKHALHGNTAQGSARKTNSQHPLHVMARGVDPQSTAAEMEPKVEDVLPHGWRWPSTGLSLPWLCCQHHFVCCPCLSSVLGCQLLGLLEEQTVYISHSASSVWETVAEYSKNITAPIRIIWSFVPSTHASSPSSAPRDRTE